MTNQKYSPAVERWLSDKPTRKTKIYRWFRAYYHQKLPSHFRPMAILHWLTKTSVAASAPAVAYFAYSSISGLQAVGAGSAIFLGHSLVSFFDRASKEKRRPDVEAAAESVIRIGELLAHARPKAKSNAAQDDAIRSALGVIEVFTRQVSKSDRGEISVAIALYAGDNNTKMQIRHRNPGNTRPTGRRFDCDGVLGHYACVAGKLTHVVHDLKGFDKSVQRSPTQSSVAYRSFLILPLLAKRHGNEQVIGFLSIDSIKPYCFFGSRARLIVVTCQPIIEHIQDLIEIRG